MLLTNNLPPLAFFNRPSSSMRPTASLIDWGTRLRQHNWKRWLTYWSKASLCNLSCCCTFALSRNGLPSWFKVTGFVSIKFARQLSLNSENVSFRAIVSCPVFIIAPQRICSERLDTFSGGVGQSQKWTQRKPASTLVFFCVYGIFRWKFDRWSHQSSRLRSISE